MTYDRAVLLAIYYFHRGNSAADAQEYLEDLVSRHKFKVLSRVSQISRKLNLYLSWAENSGLITADSNARISLDIGGFLVLGGVISRVDVTPEGYRAIVLKDPPHGWRKQVRMPLIQRAIAQKYARPVNEIEVGFQTLDGTNLSSIKYGSLGIEAAIKEFKSLGNRVRRYSAGYPPELIK